MDAGPSPPARVSRETRLLATTVLLSLVLLWVLARVRFPERPASANPVPPIFTQLAPPAGFADLAAAIADVHQRVATSIVALSTPSHGTPPFDSAVAVHLGEGLALALVPGPNGAGPPSPPRDDIVARDPATGLAVIRVAPGASPAAVWSARRLSTPRYLFAASASNGDTFVRPVLVGPLQESDSAAWGAPIWKAPPSFDTAAPAFLFAPDGALAGLSIHSESRQVIVPGTVLLQHADTLRRGAVTTPGSLGLEVRRLTAPIAAAVGVDGGVVVAWVDPRGPSATNMFPGDVIQRAGGVDVRTFEDWIARAARLTAADVVVVGVRRGDASIDVELTAETPRAAPPRPLGLAMRRRAGVGAEAVRVDSGSAAAHAGIAAGDVLTMVDGIQAPTPAQVRRAFANAPGDRPLLVTITRGQTHDVAVLEKR
jgi:hypothetical protein